MKTHIHRLAVLVAMAAISIAAQAQYPSQPIRLVVPFTAGTAADSMARILANALTPSLAPTIIVDNRPGADSILGTNAVAMAKPDGYTLLLGSNAFAALPALRKSLPYDPAKDFASVALVCGTNFYLYVNAALPVNTVAELVEYVKSQMTTYARVLKSAGVQPE